MVSDIFHFYIQFDEHIFQLGWFNHQLDTSGDFFGDKPPMVKKRL